MSSSLRVAFAVVMLACSVSRPASCQPPTAPETPSAKNERPVNAIDFRVPYRGRIQIAGMHSESNKRDASGKPLSDTEQQRYYYMPLLALQRGGGAVEVAVMDDGLIRLPLICDAPDISKVFLEYNQSRSAINGKVTDAQVLPVPIKRLVLRTSDSYIPRIEFTPLENRGLLNYTEIFEARVDPAIAQRFATDLRAGTVTLHATIVFEGYAFRENFLVIKGDEIIKGMKRNKLIGPGAPEHVTRKQLAKVAKEGASTLRVSIGTEFDDPDFATLVSDLVRLSTKESPVTKTFGTDWKKDLADFFLSGGGDPEDFKADLITSAKTQQDKEFQEKFEREVDEKLKVSGGASAGIPLVFDADLSVDVDSAKRERVLKDVLDKWSMKYEFDGKKITPKSVDLFSLQEEQVVAGQDLQFSKIRRLVSDGKQELNITSERVIDLAAIVPLETRLLELQKKVADLETALSAMKHLVKVDPASATVAIEGSVRISGDLTAGRDINCHHLESNGLRVNTSTGGVSMTLVDEGNFNVLRFYTDKGPLELGFDREGRRVRESAIK